VAPGEPLRGPQGGAEGPGWETLLLALKSTSQVRNGIQQ